MQCTKPFLPELLGVFNAFRLIKYFEQRLAQVGTILTPSRNTVSIIN